MDALQIDQENLEGLSEEYRQAVMAYHRNLDQRAAARSDDPQMPRLAMPKEGMGAASALTQYQTLIEPNLAATLGPRYWGFITGGSTPAAMLADGIVGSIDQNPSTPADSITSSVEQQVIEWLREFFNLPAAFEGVLTTGATASNLLGLICGRQFAGEQQGLDIAKAGMQGANIEVFSATAHASSVKCLGMAGLGQEYTKIATLPDREAIDLLALEQALANSQAKGKIVIANCGTVTTNDFDDLSAVADLCERHHAWLHVDAAFGLFARCLPDKAHLAKDIERADSITSDGHKWLNVPYDCGLFFSRHIDKLETSLSVAAPYLAVESSSPTFMNRGIENSRRFRALPIWFTLTAYGTEGHKNIVANNCLRAQQLANWIEQSSTYELLSPCQLNTVLFRRQSSTRHTALDLQNIDNKKHLKAINETGEVFLTPGVWQGKYGFRAAISNWKTTKDDVLRVIALLEKLSND